MARASRYEDVKQEILDEIAAVDAAHGKPPSVRDLAGRFEVSVSTMHSFLKKMLEEGMVEWKPGRHRTLRPAIQQITRVSSP
jgi:DNA-binding transcriptional regulator YhcF (GntR family)